MLKLFVKISIIILLLFSCQDEESDLKFPTSKKMIIAESYISPNKNFELSLMNSNVLSDKILLNLIWNASAMIYNDNGDTMKLKNIINTEKGYFYNYGINKIATTDYKGNYYLKITTLTGDTLFSKTNTLNQTNIKDYKINETNISMSFNNDSIETERFYRITIDKRVNKKRYVYEEIYDFQKSDKPLLDATIKGDFSQYDTLFLSLFHITKDNYIFIDSYTKARKSNVDFFQVPYLVKSNINNAIGIFSYYTKDYVMIKKQKSL